jgi:hypothetical protein
VTLTERCARLEARVTWAKELGKLQYAAEKLGERTARLEPVRRKVQADVERAAVLRAAAVPLELPPCHGAVEVCREQAEVLRGTAKADAVLDENVWRRVSKAIDDDAAALAACVRETVDATQARVRALNPSKYQATAAAQNKQAEFARWTAQRDALLQPPPWYTRSAAELRRLLKQSDDLVKAGDVLDYPGAPDDVRRFLELARQGEARFADLGPEVRGWLEEKGLLANLRITLGGR